MTMQMAMLLAALCSNSTGVFAFRLPAPRTGFGCQQGSRPESVVFQHAIEGARTTAMVGRSVLFGVNANSSGVEEIKVGVGF